jgi:DNA repair protein RecO (recombination protein O)
LIVKTEAIVFKTINYSESSVIATIFTRSHGVVSVIAKGARKPRSKFSAYLVPGQILEVLFYWKPTRNIQTLSDASYLKKLDQFRSNLEKMALIMTTVELTSQLLHENEVNESLFELISTFFTWVHDQHSVSRAMFPYIQLRVLDKVGIGLQVEEGLETNLPSKGYINIETGSLSNHQEGEQSQPLSENQFQFVIESLTRKNSAIFEKKFKNGELSQLIEYLDRYIRYHVEGVRPRKSDSIFEKILNSPI